MKIWHCFGGQERALPELKTWRESLPRPRRPCPVPGWERPGGKDARTTHTCALTGWFRGVERAWCTPHSSAQVTAAIISTLGHLEGIIQLCCYGVEYRSVYSGVVVHLSTYNNNNNNNSRWCSACWLAVRKRFLRYRLKKRQPDT